MDELFIFDILCDLVQVEVLLVLIVDELIVFMIFQVNDFLFVGKEGKYVISCNIKECLEKELLYNVVLCVEEGELVDKFKVFGCGELYLLVLIENMCCENFELVVGCFEVVICEIDGVW